MTQELPFVTGPTCIPVEEYPYLRGEFPGIQDGTLALGGWPVIEALRIASRAHAKAGQPTYVRDHLLPVVNLLSFILLVGESIPQAEARQILCAAALHDVFEATPMDRENPEFPEEVPATDPFWQGVYRLVAAVTDRPGKNRQARHKATYPGIRAAGVPAVLVKLGDRCKNVARCWENRDARLFMYHREHPYFYVTLYHPQDPPPVQAMWSHLNALLWFDPDKDRRIPDRYRPSSWKSPQDD